ncbi:hypothetical protein LX32DRAFT_325410 [Colletotrichum zoysiae]|uniref:Secreted protein n=1 Tax=Colletotrichum zoysiae TaxID=1216348 RepID=A0AAD9HK65_9PEZI|nr:hypothetical protein LX32DRAFT_325410 [Colletotrichum zoysiae]
MSSCCVVIACTFHTVPVSCVSTYSVGKYFHQNSFTDYRGRLQGDNACERIACAGSMTEPKTAPQHEDSRNANRRKGNRGGVFASRATRISMYVNQKRLPAPTSMGPSSCLASFPMQPVCFCHGIISVPALILCHHVSTTQFPIFEPYPWT